MYLQDKKRNKGCNQKTFQKKIKKSIDKQYKK